MSPAKPTLVLALGNRLMGDDAIACHVAERLAVDEAVLAEAEVIVGENDLLRIADRLGGRERVVIVDAALDEAAPGTVSVTDGLLVSAEPDSRQAHVMSAAETLELLRVVGGLPADVTVITIAVGSVRVREGLSPALERALPTITKRVERVILNGRSP